MCKSGINCFVMLMSLVAAVVVWGCNSNPSASRDEASETHATDANSEEDAEVTAALVELSDEDRRAAEAQKFCAVVRDSLLGSMGTPFKLTIEGQPVFLCCEGCKEAALANPKETLANVEQLKAVNSPRGSRKSADPE